MPLVFGASDLRAFCRQGSTVSFNGVSTYADDGSPIKGNFDRPTMIKLMESNFTGASVSLPTICLPFNAFSPMPRANDLILVDGEPYAVETPTAEDDGAFLCYELQRASD